MGHTLAVTVGDPTGYLLEETSRFVLLESAVGLAFQMSVERGPSYVLHYDEHLARGIDRFVELDDVGVV